jgi:menaquinone-dependent protoporphyrinogen oxidase
LARKILVGYASGFGTTKEIAEYVGKVLSEHDLEVELQALAEVKDISKYQGIVFGASIRAGNLLPAAMDFASRFKFALAKVPVAVFVVCLTMQEDTEENRAIVSCWLNPLREIITPFGEGLFAGRLIMKELPFAPGLLAKLIKEPEGDYRDWEKIKEWTEGLVPVLSGASCPIPEKGEKPIC